MPGSALVSTLVEKMSPFPGTKYLLVLVMQRIILKAWLNTPGQSLTETPAQYKLPNAV